LEWLCRINFLYTYGGLGDRHQQNGVNYTLDLVAGLTQVLSDGTNTYLYGNGRIAQHATQSGYFLGDALGSVRQLADTAGAVTLTQSYAPYGEVTQSVGTSQTSYGFTNEFTDPNGLVYLRARYYAPTDGRFISRDTWNGDYNRPLSLNRWGYVEGNPILFTDPSGNRPRVPHSQIDRLPVTLLDPRSLGYYAGENVDLMPYLFYLNPYDFTMTASINFTPPGGHIASQRAMEVLRAVAFKSIGQGGIPDIPGEDENYPVVFSLNDREGENFWSRLVEVHGNPQTMFNAWFVVTKETGEAMVKETFPLDVPYPYDLRASLYLKPKTQNNNRAIVLTSQSMKLRVGKAFGLGELLGCSPLNALPVTIPINVWLPSGSPADVSNLFSITFTTRQIGQTNSIETEGRIELVGVPQPVGSVFFRGYYTGPQWKLHVLD